MCPIVGANWNNGAAAGVWALNLNNVRANANNNVGGRADSNPYMPLSNTGKNGIKGDVFRQRLIGAAKSAYRRIFGRAWIVRKPSLEDQAANP